MENDYKSALGTNSAVKHKYRKTYYRCKSCGEKVFKVDGRSGGYCEKCKKMNTKEREKKYKYITIHNGLQYRNDAMGKECSFYWNK